MRQREGALQIRADYPWFGAGWNQPETLYSHFYKPPRIEEGMAIQLNDYFNLGMTLGLPALVCFGAWIGLAFTQAPKAGSPALELARNGPDVNSNLQFATSNVQLLRAACRAGAIVLLAGAWFDGSFFKLATTVPLWMLIELGALNSECGTQSGQAVGAEIRWYRERPLRTVILGFLLLAGAMLWAKGRDPFMRSWFEVNVAPKEKVNCVAVLPKPVRAPVVVVYLHGAGGALQSDGPDLKQIAEMGLAVVSVEYDQTNAAVCDRQFAAVLAHLRRQRWVDTNAVAWAGFSLGANRVLSFALRHPELQPRLLVRLAGGEVEELRPTRNAEVETRNGNRPAGLQCPVWLVHGAQDEVFPLAEAERAAVALQSQGVRVELSSLAGLGHTFGPERGVVFRAVGEHCLTHLAGPSAWTGYHSLARWQADAWPLWVWCLPAALWIGVSASRAWRSYRQTEGMPRCERLTRAEYAVRGLATLLALAALALIGTRWILPRLPANQSTLVLARWILVQAKSRADFDWLAVQAGSQGQRVGTLVEHAELANYNRGLVNWKLDDANFREFVLSPLIEAGRPIAEDWRRPFWESLYPQRAVACNRGGSRRAPLAGASERDGSGR